MDINTSEDVEYGRLNQEQNMRIEKIYSDGALVTSILLVYLIACLSGLFGAYQYILSDGAQYSDVLIFPISILSIALFIVPVLLCYTFALKSKEMMDSIISLSNFIKVYFEKPILAEGTIKGKKWESMHKNTMVSSIHHERKEYYFIALLSIILILCCGISEIKAVLTIGSIVNFSFWFVIITKICFIVYAVIITRKIRYKTNMKAVFTEIKSTELFYQNQKTYLENCKENESLKINIEEIGITDLVFRIFLVKKHISPYKALELEKLFYGKDCNENDKIINKIDREAQKENNNIGNKKERVKAYLKTEIKNIRDKYL